MPEQHVETATTTRLLAPLAAGLVALALSYAAPLMSPLLIALVIGVAVVNSPLRGSRVFIGHAAVTRSMLQVGVVLLGLRLPLQDILALGPRGLTVIALTVSLTFTTTCFLGDRLGLDRGLVTLIAAGFSICGAAAIAAVEGGISRRREDVALAVAMVTIFGSAMIVIVPVVSRLAGLTAHQQGVWAGASIHEVAQVVAAATTAGAAAVAIATTVKLGRVSLLALAYAAARRRCGDVPAGETTPAIVPWFVVGFLVAAALRSSGLVPQAVLHGADLATTLLLAAAMFGLGLGMHLRSLLPVSPRVFVLALSSTSVAASVSLALTVVLF